MLKSIGGMLALASIPALLPAYTFRVTHPTASGGVVELEGIAGTSTGALSFGVELEVPPGQPGIHAWNVGLSHDSSVLTVDVATLDGTAADTLNAEFSSVDIVTSGIVSSVILDTPHAVLLPAASTSNVLLATYSGIYPAKDTTVQTRLRLVDGLEGPRGALTTDATAWNGVSEVAVIPVRENLIVLLSGFEYSTAFDLSLTTDGARPVAGEDVLTGFIRPGSHPSYRVKALLESKLPPASTSGAQGWSLSIEHDPTFLQPGPPTIQGTQAGSLFSGGFQKHEIIANDSGNGVISAVVLSLTEPVSFPPVSRHDILVIDYRWTRDTSVPGKPPATSIEFRDKLRGQGQPVNNVVTHLGASNRPFVRRKLMLDLEVGDPPVQPFIRSDANDDGHGNIADAIWILSELFFRGPPTLCFSAADANADGLKDITDVAFLLQYYFLAGRAPSAPFPECGAVLEEDPTRCPLGSTSCSAP